MFHVYIMASQTGTLYVGMTKDLESRVFQHKQGQIKGFTQKHGCTRLIYYEEIQYADKAIAREKQLKGWNRAKKAALIQSFNSAWKDLAGDW